MSGLESQQPDASGAANSWGAAVDDVAFLFDYADFEPVREDDEYLELTRVERSLERARDTTTRWRGHVEMVRERLQPYARIAVALLMLLSGVASLLGVGVARIPFVVTVVLVVSVVSGKRFVRRRRAREAARRIAEQRRALTLIEGPRRVPVDVLRLRESAPDFRPRERMRERIDSI